MYTTLVLPSAMPSLLPPPATSFKTSVVIDWSKERLPCKHDPSQLLRWVQSYPSKRDIHVFLGNVHFNGQRALMRQLQALGCTVTCRVYADHYATRLR